MKLRRFAPARVFMLDLDNTLVHSTRRIFPAIETRMREYLLANGFATERTVDRLLKQARRHGQGVTVVGLRELLGIDGREFLSYSHSQLGLSSCISQHRGLKSWLAIAPGTCVIASDGPYTYCAEVVCALGIGRWVSEIVSIDRINFTPKASRRYWPELRRIYGLLATQCTLLDDRRDCITNAVRFGASGFRISRPAHLPLIRSVLGRKDAAR